MRASWQGLSLARQFLIVAGLLLVVAMFTLGEWFSRQIEQSALATAGLATATLIDSYLEPPLQRLGTAGVFDADMAAVLDKIFEEREPAGQLVSIKIWSKEGEILYSTNRLLVGRQFPDEEVAAAFEGTTSVEFNSLDEVESESERALGIPLVEIYVPLHSATTGKIIAVGEFYENGQRLSEELTRWRIINWGIIGGTTLLLLSSLYLIVQRGSTTINTQKQVLRDQVAEARVLASQNEQLRVEAENARLEASVANEQLLAHIGADLHDGPVQLLTLMMLKLSSRKDAPQASTSSEGEEILALVETTLRELRGISTGLLLPEIADISLDQALQLAVFRHEDLTATKVSCAFGPLPEDVPTAIKTCFYRVVQEGLNNAYRHGKGIGQFVSAAYDENGAVIVTVSDHGPGLGEATPEEPRQRLGLVGMANRVGALRGTLVLESGPGQGARITVAIPIPQASA
jgi:signal transduction histidine kinase